LSDNPYAEVIADIAGGARLHYENPDPDDADLDLLLGDQSYASGLLKLAALRRPMPRVRMRLRGACSRRRKPDSVATAEGYEAPFRL
jgi:hypothetical protein